MLSMLFMLNANCICFRFQFILSTFIGNTNCSEPLRLLTKKKKMRKENISKSTVIKMSESLNLISLYRCMTKDIEFHKPLKHNRCKPIQIKCNVAI